MKRLVACILAIVVMFGMIGTTTAEKSQTVGEILKESSLQYIELYRLMRDMGIEFRDDQLDELLSYLVMYYDGCMLSMIDNERIFHFNNLDSSMKGYALILTSLSSHRTGYSDGTKTKEQYQDILFRMVDIILETK